MAKYPGIPIPTDDPTTVRLSAEALKSGFEMLTGQRKTTDLTSIAATKSDLATLTTNLATTNTNLVTTNTNVSALQTFQTNTQAAWTAYTPTISAASGTITTATAIARYMQIGKTVFLRGQINLTNIGTAASWVGLSLPAACSAVTTYAGMGFGREVTTGAAIQIIVQPNTMIFIGNSANIVVNGYNLNGTVVYETT